MNKKILLFIITIFLFHIQIALAYIDPGTGGYLISVIWQYIVAFFAFIGATIIFFFKHRVLTLWQNKWVKLLLILMILLLIIIVLYVTFQPQPTGGLT